MQNLAWYRKKFSENTADFSAAAMGRIKSDMVIVGASVLNVFTNELILANIAIYNGFIVCVGDVGHTVGKNTKTIKANGLIATPSFMDGHVHTESSMLKVCEYAKLVLPLGTSAIFADPHEIANVLGLKGLKAYELDAASAPLKTYITLPSCVPSAAPFETSGALITAEDVATEIKKDCYIGLGEVMNDPGVLNGDKSLHSMLKQTYLSRKVATGHYTLPDLSTSLNAYVASGINCCHESTSAQEALQKIRLGMYVQLREGSASKDLKNTVSVLKDTTGANSRVMFVTDDMHADEILQKGHMNYLLKKAVEYGVNSVDAVRCVTLNVAQCFKMDDLYGSISPGKVADINLIDNLTHFNCKKVILDGKLMAENGKFLTDFESYHYPSFALNSVNIDKKFIASDFAVQASGQNMCVCAVNLKEHSIITQEERVELPVKNGQIILNSHVLKAVVIERYSGKANYSVGFVTGLALREGAIATTVAHDCHNIVAVGKTDEELSAAVNALVVSGGGQVVVGKGQVIKSILPLEVGGLYSQDGAKSTALKIEKINAAVKELGCNFESPFMTLSFMALPVIPAIRLTDKGLFDSSRFVFKNTIEENTEGTL